LKIVFFVTTKVYGNKIKQCSYLSLEQSYVWIVVDTITIFSICRKYLMYFYFVNFYFECFI